MCRIGSHRQCSGASVTVSGVIKASQCTYVVAGNEFRHFDLNHLWTQQKEFSIGIFVTIVKTMQVCQNNCN